MRERSKWSLLLVALALGCAKPAAPAPAPPKATPAPQEAQVESARDRFVGRFDTLTERLEEGLTKHHVPGMAVAVVYDDSVIWHDGQAASGRQRVGQGSHWHEELVLS